MKSAYLRFVAAVIFIALAAYLAAHFMQSADRPETLEALRVRLSETLHCEGTVLRDEVCVLSPFETAYIAVPEGGRVKGGSVVCVDEKALDAFLDYEDTHGGADPEKMQGCVYASCAGFFSSYLDGWESADADNLDSFTPEIPENAVGKIVANGWYFVADLSDASKLHEGQRLTLTVFDDYPAIVSDIDGSRVTLRVKAGLEAMLNTRFTEASLRVTELCGIKIPRDCLHRDADGYFVYTLRAGIKKKTPVSIIYEAEDYCLASEDALRKGMQICR